MWWHKNTIPLSEPNFQNIIAGLVFECPSSVKSSVLNGVNDKGEIKRKPVYKPVSVRKNSFRERKIIGKQLTTILVQIRKPLILSNSYANLTTDSDVVMTVQNLIGTSSAGDDFFELLVYKARSDMSDVEAIFYYIRNAFAHGSFEVHNHAGRRTYLIESSKDGKIKAQMRLREDTLLRYVELANMTTAEIMALQRPKKK